MEDKTVSSDLADQALKVESIVSDINKGPQSVNVVRERYTFNTRSLQPTEPVDMYVSELMGLSHTCDYGALTDSLIRDRVICEVTDDDLREHLLSNPHLMLADAVSVCMAWHKLQNLEDIQGITHSESYDDNLHDESETHEDETTEDILVAYGGAADDDIADLIHCVTSGDIKSENFDIDDDDIIKEEEGSDGYEVLMELQSEDSNESELTKKFVCIDCNVSYHTAFQLDIHEHNNHSTNLAQFACDRCSRTFSNEIYLKRHQRRHKEGQREFACDLCSKMFDTERMLEQHKDNHLQSFVCDICNKPFAYSSSLMTHMKTHSENRDFCCDTCGKTFTRRAGLVDHQAVHNKHKLPQDLRCDTCGLECKTPLGLATHCRVHIRENSGIVKEPKPKIKGQFLCDICGQGFNRKDTVRNHIRMVHNKERPFSCGECGRSMKTEWALKLHKRTHLDKKYYMCEICGREMNHKNQLDLHMKEHSGVRPFTCLHCNKSFIVESRLRRHVEESHAKKKGYNCEVCGKQYSLLRSKQRHVLKAHTAAYQVMPHVFEPADLNVQNNEGTPSDSLGQEPVSVLSHVTEQKPDLVSIEAHLHTAMVPPGEQQSVLTQQGQDPPVLAPPGTTLQVIDEHGTIQVMTEHGGPVQELVCYEEMTNQETSPQQTEIFYLIKT